MLRETSSEKSQSAKSSKKAPFCESSMEVLIVQRESQWQCYVSPEQTANPAHHPEAGINVVI